MIHNPKPRRLRHRGLSILELTIVVGVLIGLISLLFVGARAWRIGSDRANCILNQRTMQMAVRSFQNMYGYSNGAQSNGQTIAEALWTREFISQNLYRSAIGEMTCPGGGTYIIQNPNLFPEDGTLFMTCSLANEQEHRPQNFSDW